MKIVSFNVNGIRAIMRKDFTSSLQKLDADILCIQETKAQCNQVQEALKPIEGYHIYSNSAERKGYSGVAILSKEKPLRVQHGINIAAHDNEGRVLCAEYEKYYLVTVYVPNSGSKLKRLDYRENWDRDFLAYIQAIEKEKPVVVCGDFNVAHTDIDLANPKANYNKSAGYTQVEIDGMDNYLNAGFVDTYRFYNPETIKYTWWSYRTAARERNVGWRIDYFLVSESLIPHIQDAAIHNDIMGSDHCPVSLEITF